MKERFIPTDFKALDQFDDHTPEEQECKLQYMEQRVKISQMMERFGASLEEMQWLMSSGMTSLDEQFKAIDQQLGVLDAMQDQPEEKDTH